MNLYVLTSFIFGAIVYLMAKGFSAHEFWLVPLCVFALSIPICLSGLYAITIRKTQQATSFVQHGWVYRLFLGRTFKTVLWILWSLLSSFYMLIQFQFYQTADWMLLFLVVPVFYILYLFFSRILSHEVKAYLVTNIALTWASWCTAILMLCAYFIFLLNYSGIPIYSSLSIAITAQKSGVAAGAENNALVWNALQFLADFEAVKFYALGQLSLINKQWAVLVLVLANFVIFYNACKVLSFLLIPKHQYLRIVAPLTDTEQPVAVAKSSIAIVSAVFTFIILFIYLPLFATLESIALQSPELQAFREDMEHKMVRIDNDFYRASVLPELQQAQLQALHKSELSLITLEAQVDRAFDRLNVNVDGYLDWYYSLGAEYARIGHLMMGDFEPYMTLQLLNSLQQGDAFKSVQYALDSALNTHKQAAEEYQQVSKQILANNRVEHIVSKTQVVQALAMNDVFQVPLHKDAINLQYRLGGSSAATTVGALGGFVVSKIIAKVASKATFKLAVKGVSKIAISKAAGTTGGVSAGAITGAAIGSIIPGAGTAIGAVVGGVIGGIATGLVIDKSLIELESYLNRELFKQSIISAINEARGEFKSNLRGRE